MKQRVKGLLALLLAFAMVLGGMPAEARAEVVLPDISEAVASVTITRAENDTPITAENPVRYNDGKGFKAHVELKPEAKESTISYVWWCNDMDLSRPTQEIDYCPGFGTQIYCIITVDGYSGSIESEKYTVEKGYFGEYDLPFNGVVDDTCGTDTFTFDYYGYGGNFEYRIRKNATAEWSDWNELPGEDTCGELAQGVITVGNVNRGIGDIQVRTQESSKSICAEEDYLSNTAPFTADLAGTVALSGEMTPGSTLTATVTLDEAAYPEDEKPTELLYTFKRGEETVQAQSTSNTYQVQEADMGNQITVEVTSTGYNGSLTASTLPFLKGSVGIFTYYTSEPRDVLLFTEMYKVSSSIESPSPYYGERIYSLWCRSGSDGTVRQLELRGYFMLGDPGVTGDDVIWAELTIADALGSLKSPEYTIQKKLYSEDTLELSVNDAYDYGDFLEWEDSGGETKGKVQYRVKGNDGTWSDWTDSMGEVEGYAYIGAIPIGNVNRTAGDIEVRIPENGTYENPDPALVWTNAEPFTAVEVSLTGNAKVGETLTANLPLDEKNFPDITSEDYEHKAFYTFKRGDTVVQEESENASYTITEADIGSAITVSVTLKEFHISSGSLISEYPPLTVTSDTVPYMPLVGTATLISGDYEFSDTIPYYNLLEVKFVDTTAAMGNSHTYTYQWYRLAQGTETPEEIDGSWAFYSDHWQNVRVGDTLWVEITGSGGGTVTTPRYTVTKGDYNFNFSMFPPELADFLGAQESDIYGVDAFLFAWMGLDSDALTHAFEYRIRESAEAAWPEEWTTCEVENDVVEIYFIAPVGNRNLPADCVQIRPKETEFLCVHPNDVTTYLWSNETPFTAVEVSLTGTATVGENLTATVAPVDDANFPDPWGDGIKSIIYTFMRGTTQLQTGEENTYVIQQEDIGSAITVNAEVVYTYADYPDDTVTYGPLTATGKVVKARIIGVEPPADITLTQYYENGNAVINAASCELPATVNVTVETVNGQSTVPMAVEWSCNSYDATHGAENTFGWMIPATEFADYNGNGQTMSGSITVTNVAVGLYSENDFWFDEEMTLPDAYGTDGFQWQASEKTEGKVQYRVKNSNGTWSDWMENTGTIVSTAAVYEGIIEVGNLTLGAGDIEVRIPDNDHYANPDPDNPIIWTNDENYLFTAVKVGLTGNAKVGEILTANLTMDEKNFPYINYPEFVKYEVSYKFIGVGENGSETELQNSTAATYTLKQTDAGSKIKVEITVTMVAADGSASQTLSPLTATLNEKVEAAATPTPKPTAIPTPVPADKSEIESCLFDAVYYAMANADVAETLGTAPSVLYEHWLTCGKAEGRSASLVFDAKYYLQVNPDVATLVGSDYEAAYEHFVAYGLEEGRESSPVFDVKYYLRTNTDVAQAFGYDYVKAAAHFNANALAEGRSGSDNFDYTVYRYCNTDVAALYGDDIVGYYIHYINYGRAEGRTAGFGSGPEIVIDTNAVSYRIFDKDYYLENYPALARTVGTTEEALYRYWLSEGIALGHVASPVFDPAEYLRINTDVAAALGNDPAAAATHFFNYGIYEGRTGVREFDYTVYKFCNTDVADVFGEDIVGYYFHYVKYGRAEGRTAKIQ